MKTRMLSLCMMALAFCIPVHAGKVISIIANNGTATKGTKFDLDKATVETNPAEAGGLPHAHNIFGSGNTVAKNGLTFFDPGSDFGLGQAVIVEESAAVQNESFFNGVNLLRDVLDILSPRTFRAPVGIRVSSREARALSNPDEPTRTIEAPEGGKIIIIVKVKLPGDGAEELRKVVALVRRMLGDKLRRDVTVVLDGPAGQLKPVAGTGEPVLSTKAKEAGDLDPTIVATIALTKSRSTAGESERLNLLIGLGVNVNQVRNLLKSKERASLHHVLRVLGDSISIGRADKFARVVHQQRRAGIDPATVALNQEAAAWLHGEYAASVAALAVLQTGADAARLHRTHEKILRLRQLATTLGIRF